MNPLKPIQSMRAHWTDLVYPLIAILSFAGIVALVTLCASHGSITIASPTTPNTFRTGSLVVDDVSTFGGSASFNGDVALGDGSADHIAFTGSASTALNMNAHRVNGVTDPAAAQDALTLNYFNTHTGSASIGGTLTSGTIPVASGAHTLGDSPLTVSGGVVTTTGLIQTGTLDIKNDLISTAAPTSVNFGSLTATSTDFAGTINGGSSPSVVLTFSGSGFATTSVCTVAPTGATPQFLTVTSTATTATFLCFGAFTGTAQNCFTMNYTCVGKR